MKYEKHVLRVTKGKDFIMIDLLSPDSNATTSAEPLGAIVLSKNQWKDLKKFIEENPGFEKDLLDENNTDSHW